MNVKAVDADPPPRSRKAEQAEATRAALVDAARELFAERGFGNVATEEIVRRARVTRGALYHHFTGKEDLFRAAYAATSQQLLERIATAAASEADPLARLRVAADTFLEACREPAVQQIALIDAPSVLGWEAWREADGGAALTFIQLTLEEAMDAGAIARAPARPLAHLLLGALDEGALLVARADDPQTARAELGTAIDHLLTGLTR